MLIPKRTRSFKVFESRTLLLIVSKAHLLFSVNWLCAVEKAHCRVLIVTTHFYKYFLEFKSLIFLKKWTRNQIMIKGRRVSHQILWTCGNCEGKIKTENKASLEKTLKEKIGGESKLHEPKHTKKKEDKKGRSENWLYWQWLMRDNGTVWGKFRNTFFPFCFSFLRSRLDGTRRYCVLLKIWG